MLTNRKKVLLAGAGSVLLHAVLLLGAAVVIARQPPPPTPAPPDPFHLELVKSEPAFPPPAAPTPEHRMVDTDDMQQAEHPRPDARFEGDKDTVAASEEPASGDKPLPTQKGRAAPIYAFNTAPPPPASDPVSEPPPPAPATAPPPPAPSRALVRNPPDAPAPTLVRNDLPMLDPAPSTPSPEEVNPYDPSFRSTAPPLPTPVRRATPASAYRPMQERTASSGSITTLGASSVDAVATPFGRYQHLLLSSIRKVWNQEIQARSDIASLGTVKVRFAIDRTGHVHTPQVISNSSNEALASITVEAITTAPIPPIPPDVVETMNGAMLQMEVNFECL